MPDWLNGVTAEVDESLATLATRLALSWLCGWIVSLLARSKRPAETPDTLTLTLVLMSILIAMATQIIGDNIARAFSLVGALSIVRFRTAVPAPRDVAFVLAAVVVGMAVGAGQYWVALLGLVVVALAIQFNTPSEHDSDSGQDPESLAAKRWRLTLKVGLNLGGEWEAVLDRLTESHELVSAETARRGGALELVYRYRPRGGTDAGMLIAALNAIPTVESAAARPT